MKNFRFLDLPKNSHIHMVGIGGISMSALAHMLKHFGYNVSGSDRAESSSTQKLACEGFNIHIGHNAENLQAPDLVCYTAAIPKDNPEIVKARSLGIPCLERAELLGQLMESYKHPIAVAGTHGKTTTTSMLSLVFLEAGLDPTILVGGELSQIDGNYHIGSQNHLIFEACEYVESFLNFHPYLSIITNVEEDHLDYFSDLNHIITSFKKFTSLNSPSGCIIVCSDDKNATEVVKDIQKKVVTFGLLSKNNDFFAENPHVNDQGMTQFDVYAYGEKVTTLRLFVHGEHNVRNALAAFAAAWEMSVDPGAIKRGLESYTGTKRRYEKLGEVAGIKVIDDYAHHPTEIETTLKSAKNVSQGKVWCIFQPHTFSRTKAFLGEFAKALEVADTTIVTDIYPAREPFDGTIHSCDVVRLMKNGVYINDFGAIKRYMLENAKKGDTIITMGAGDVFKIGHLLINES